MKELKITQDAVLKAAEQNKDLAGLLQTLFPDAFEEKDTLAIKKGVFNDWRDNNLKEFCKKAFLNGDAIQITDGCSRDENHRLRSLIVPLLKVVVLETDHGTIIEFHKK
jgi:hypothetical protein